MIWLYRLIFLPALLVVLPWFLWRTRGRGDWRSGVRNRLGRYEGLPAKRPGVPRIWLQAVSVGEVLAVIPLVQALRRDVGCEIVLTTTTTTGYALARERLAEDVIGVGFFPIDFWPWSARAWREIEPDLAVLTEGERWPEHIRQAARRGNPVVSVNARLSERGWRRARAWRWLVRPLWQGITRILPGTSTDRDRFLALGFDPARVTCVGNLKLDVRFPELGESELAALRQATGLPDGPIIVGASTWPGEEQALLRWLQRARAAGVAARLLLVPRHVERRDELTALLSAAGFTWHRRSDGDAAGPVEVLLADTTGELRQLLQLGDLVFVGRSLPPHRGGQTPIEAAGLGRVIVFGPGMDNFRETADGLVAAGAALLVADADALAEQGTSLLQDGNRRRAMASAARAWIEANRGATERTRREIESLLAQSDS